MPTGCLPNPVPHRSTAFGLAIPNPGMARVARSGASGCWSVIRTAWGPIDSIFETMERSSNPPNWEPQYSKASPALTWFSCWGCPERRQRSKFQTTAAASSGVPSWKATFRLRWKVHTVPSDDASHRSARPGLISAVGPSNRTRVS